ncbi:putative RNA-binding protein 15B [Halotydeus destructor]|nr:putative RNA-binding protein 15B [Halotydeus destructor]
MPRYDDSPRDRSPIDRGSGRDGGGGGGGNRSIPGGNGRAMKSPDRRRPREGSPVGRGQPTRDPYDDYPPPREQRQSMPYKILCVANLNSKVSDSSIRDALMREFSRFGEVSVKVCHDANERFAYIYFRSYEEAREARHAKARLILFDKAVEIDPIYERLPARRRSITPDYGPPPPRNMRGPSPVRNRAPPPPPQHSMRAGTREPPPMYSNRDSRSHPEMHREVRDYNSHPPTGPSNSSNNSNNSNNANNPNQRRESKKEKFPNYLHHVAPEEDDKATRTLFVGNLEVTITDADLRRIFERYGVVEDIDVKRPPPGQGNAYAFIKLLNLDMAHRAKVEMSGQYIGKFQCKIGYGKATPTTRIWVGGLGPWTSLSHLEREFDRFGAIRKIDFVKGDNHAYIQYDSIDAAQAACQEMRGFPLGGQDKRLRVDFADPGPYSSTNVESPSHAPTKAASDDPYYNTANRRERAGGDGPEESWPRDASPPPPRFHRDRASADYDAYDKNHVPRPARAASDYASGDRDSVRSGEHKRTAERGGERGSGEFAGSYVRGGERDRGWYEDREASPNGTDRRAGAKRSGKTPEVDDVERKKGRRSPYSDAGAAAVVGDRALSPKRHRTAGEARRSPSFEEPDERTVVITDGVTSIPELVKCCPQAWNGGLILKNNAFAAKMLMCSGDFNLVDLMMKPSGQEVPMLRITQRLRLDPAKLEDVSRRMTTAGPQGYSMLLTTAGANSAAIAAGTGEDGGSVQQRPLKNLVTYLKQKEAAGVISLNGGPGKDGKDQLGVLYAFPPCVFAADLLKRVAPKFTPDSSKEDYLVVVVVRGTN